MCLIRVRKDDEEVIPTRVVRTRPETTTVITPIPPAPLPPPSTTLSNTLVPTTAIYDTSNDYVSDSYHNTSRSNIYNNHTNSEHYTTVPTTAIIEYDSERDIHRSESKRRRRRHRHRSGSREREVTTYQYRDGELDTTVHSGGASRARSIDYRRGSGYYGQSPRSSYRYIDPRGSSHRVISGGTATVSATMTTKDHRRTVSASETRGRERSREREMLTYGNPRLSTASYKSYGGGGRRSRERVIVVDDEHGRIKYY